MHVCAESFVTNLISVDRELRGAGACDTCCSRTVAGQEWMNDYVHSLQKVKLKYWTLPCQQRFKFGAGDLVSFRGATKGDALDWQRHDDLTSRIPLEFLQVLEILRAKC